MSGELPDAVASSGRARVGRPLERLALQTATTSADTPMKATTPATRAAAPGPPHRDVPDRPATRAAVIPSPSARATSAIDAGRSSGFLASMGVTRAASQAGSPVTAGDRGRRPEHVRGEQLLHRLAHERRLAAQHLVEDAAERVDVGALVDLAPRRAHCSGDMYTGVPSSHRSAHRAAARTRRPPAASRCRSRAP